MVIYRGAPITVLLLQKCCSLGKYRRTVYQTSVLVLTFLAYTAYHMSRRPLAVVKNSLNQNCSRLTPPPGMILNNSTIDNWCDWAPFDKKNANRLLGLLDSVYVFSYAVCMFISGMAAERIDLRYYLSIGMILSGLFTYLFGLAFYLNIHSLSFFIIVQILGGGIQCTGWPGVVSCVGNWFGKARRGLIFGIWNAHLYVGNILGAYVAGHFVAYNWGLSFIIPGCIVGFVGFMLFLFLVPHPENVDLDDAVHHIPPKKPQPDIFIPNGNERHVKCDLMTSPGSNGFCENSTLIAKSTESEKHSTKKAITFWDALRIPGVIEFSLCLFFSKLVSYTFLFWLPRYLDSTTGLGSQSSAYLSIAFDVGGILGGIIAGTISDHTGASALTCVGFLGFAIPSLFIYQAYGSASKIINIILQIICGALVNGPYALITTAVSTELGTHPSIKSNSKALSTVTAIIDGTGSVGAAVGPLLAGLVSETSWSYVFYMMMLADLCALVSLIRTAIKEARQCYGLHFRCILPFSCCKPYEGTYEEIGR
ncbi:glucose-6-phosphate exchanger SLC37A2 [Trichonephila inaurata madagascariensis]|uniref:Sugar phosphate exchanger 3 n=1 Tax=Trichonephila inaurata madagascariensis TaxID=2747483 RepID=A0A8X6XET8_9ARAC|nr:glucose-6-phosphate exchanger SLC37A2 [Trichonephila inaurata madagascariensis]